SPRSLPFVPIALVTVIFLHIIVAVVYYTSRIKDHSRVQYSTTDGDGVVPFCNADLISAFGIQNTSTRCTLENRGQQRITAHTGGSVLLPCYCTDLQTKPEGLIWQKENRNTQTYEEISRESGQYRNRVQLFNDHSPGNLSLLISHLTEEDGGDYQCTIKDSHAIIRLTVKGGPITTTTSTTTSSQTPNGDSVSVISFSLIPVLLLLMVLGGVIYWRYRGRRQGQTESREQQQTEREQDSQDDVTYSTIVLSRTPAAPTVIGIEDKAEYAILKIRNKVQGDVEPETARNGKGMKPRACPRQEVDGCTLVNRGQLLPITAHTGGLVLLPCSCTDLQTTPEEFSWKKYKGNTWVDTTFNSDQYRNKVQMYNHRSPGNLSLLISHLTEEDGGEYQCAVKGSYLIIRLTLEGNFIYWFILIPVVLLLLGIIGVIYWRCRGRTGGQQKT
ncbi:hypothetical protein NFI96_007953, partial [Prochilodus magdalenae]